MKLFFGAAFCALCAVPAIVSAQTLAEDAGRFGARQTVVSPSISPSGARLLYIKPGAQADETIYVVDLDSDAPPTPIMAFNESQSRLQSCSWATDERIVCQIFGFQEGGGLILGFTRMVALKFDGTEAKRLTPNTSWRTMGALQNGGSLVALDIEGEEDKILMTRQYIKESSEMTRIFNDKEGLGVDTVDVKTGRGRSMEPANRNAIRYVADENGTVRVMVIRDNAVGGYDGSETRYFYRQIGSRKWEPLTVMDGSGKEAEGFFPLAVDTAKNIAYGFDDVGGYSAVFTVTLDGSGKREQIMARGGVDVDGLIRIGRQNRVVGGSYATEKRYVEYFDPELERLADGLAKALPGKPLVSVVDANDDESRILLIASSDTDPGTLYLYEKESRSLSELLPLRDPLVGVEMGAMTPISYPAGDGTEIPGYLTLPLGSDGKNLPTIIMPHGGPEARDEWGFDWMVQFFTSQGYAVVQPNFRGSSGYGDAWFGKNGYQAWETAIGDVNDAGRWAVAQGIADPEKLAIVGWSYGGYAALQSQVLDPGLFKAVAAIAPVTDLDLLREENRRYTNFLRMDKRIGNGPHVAAGSPARHAEKFQAPVFLVHGTLDQNVGDAHSRLMESRLESAGKPVDYLEFKGLDHYLLHGQARGIMLNRLGKFLDTSLEK